MIVVASPSPPAYLHGTTAQVAFARRIREEFLAETDEIRDRVAARLRFGLVAEADVAGLQAIVRAIDCVRRVDRADWWIAQRGRSVHTLLAETGRRILAGDRGQLVVAQRRTTPRVLNRRVHSVPAGSVYVGRPSSWGNRFVIGRDGDRAAVITKYERWLHGTPHLLARLGELRGHDLVCWCAPLACHADVLLRLANASSDESRSGPPRR